MNTSLTWLQIHQINKVDSMWEQFEQRILGLMHPRNCKSEIWHQTTRFHLHVQTLSVILCLLLEVKLIDGGFMITKASLIEMSTVHHLRKYNLIFPCQFCYNSVFCVRCKIITFFACPPCVPHVDRGPSHSTAVAVKYFPPKKHELLWVLQLFRRS